MELIFKWIKQHVRIKKFLGTSENAVKMQIWCAVATYVRIAIVKKELQLGAYLHTLLQSLSVSVFEKSQLSSALRPDLDTPEMPLDANQLNVHFLTGHYWEHLMIQTRITSPLSDQRMLSTSLRVAASMPLLSSAAIASSITATNSCSLIFIALCVVSMSWPV